MSPNHGTLVKMEEFTLFISVITHVGQTEIHTLHMTMLGHGGEPCSRHWETSTPTCFSPLKMLRSITKVTFLTLIEVGVKALDDRTLQVTLKYPTPYFLQLLDHYSLFPVHQATIEKFGDADQRGTRWTYEGNLVGNGPFQVS